MKKEIVIEGKTVKIGDWVGFKCDIEQSGRVKEIRSHTLILEDPDGFQGEYIGRDTVTEVDIDRCWVD